MKILITGSNGQLGSQLKEILNKGTTEINYIDNIYKKSQVFACDVDSLDITNLETCIIIFNEIKPDIVINSAAFTNVDACEENADLAFKVNSLGARNVAIASQKVGAKLVHISTDYVFDGQATVPYREFDLPNPQSIYGKTKLLGENYVKEFCDKYFIIRTAWLYGYNGKNFVKTIINLAKEKDFIEVVDDQKGNPTNVEDLAHHILKIALTEEYGIYHCSGEGLCSWYDFAKKIVEYAKIDCEVIPTTSDKFIRPAKRPSFSALDKMMLRSTVGNEMRYWEDALKVYIEKLGKDGLI